MKKTPLLLIALLILTISSCALKPISSEYTFEKTNISGLKLDQLGNGKILFYNGADILHKIDNTGRLNIWIEGKALGQIRPREYVILNFESGNYKIDVLHIDIVNMRSEHQIEIDSTTKIIRIEPTITSNKVTVTNEFPKKFEKFKYAASR